MNALLHVLAAILVPAFLCGMVGSAIVVLVTVVRDVRDFRSTDPAPAAAETSKTNLQA